ncbi:hypothetical protein [Dactylosporangium sp. CA-139066]|uniref:hypothetical protein n=1 Tax=Dactylosporangium sp. CA-139066 TaxID=3239930 RepID=UPI003D94243F
MRDHDLEQDRHGARLRALDALLRAARQPDLDHYIGVKIGKAIAKFLPCDFAADVHTDTFPESVRRGIDRAPKLERSSDPLRWDVRSPSDRDHGTSAGGQHH